MEGSEKETVGHGGSIFLPEKRNTSSKGLYSGVKRAKSVPRRKKRNGGTAIIDAIRSPSNIGYPQDTPLLNAARENAEAIIGELHTPGEEKPCVCPKH